MKVNPTSFSMVTKYLVTKNKLVVVTIYVYLLIQILIFYIQKIRIMLLTTMPGGLDYFILISVFSLGISFIASILIIGIIAIIKKAEKTTKNYLILCLKIFGGIFLGIELIAFIILFTI